MGNLQLISSNNWTESVWPWKKPWTSIQGHCQTHVFMNSFITFQQLFWFEGCVCRAQAAGGVAQEVRKGGGHRHHWGFPSPLQHWWEFVNHWELVWSRELVLWHRGKRRIYWRDGNLSCLVKKKNPSLIIKLKLYQRLPNLFFEWSPKQVTP